MNTRVNVTVDNSCLVNYKDHLSTRRTGDEQESHRKHEKSPYDNRNNSSDVQTYSSR